MDNFNETDHKDKEPVATMDSLCFDFYLNGSQPTSSVSCSYINDNNLVVNNDTNIENITRINELGARESPIGSSSNALHPDLTDLDDIKGVDDDIKGGGNVTSFEQQQQQQQQQQLHKMNRINPDSPISKIISKFNLCRISPWFEPPKYQCLRIIPCYKGNQSFFILNSTRRGGFCSRCKSFKKAASSIDKRRREYFCSSCGYLLVPGYREYYPWLLEFEPLHYDRTADLYEFYRPLFGFYGITWSNDAERNVIMDKFAIFKVIVNTQKCPINALMIERTYMIGVFAGSYGTAAITRTLMKNFMGLHSLKFSYFNGFNLSFDELKKVALLLNTEIFGGEREVFFRCVINYIEVWYNPWVYPKKNIIEIIKTYSNIVYLRRNIDKH